MLLEAAAQSFTPGPKRSCSLCSVGTLRKGVAPPNLAVNHIKMCIAKKKKRLIYTLLVTFKGPVCKICDI